MSDGAAAARAAFWDFSLALYGKPEVATACLDLQDRHGRDVNLVLYLCWLGMSGRGRVDPAGLARAEAAVAPWRRLAIEPLRKARRSLSPAERKGVAALYDAAKAMELAAERLGQERLAALAPQPSAGPAAARLADAAANLTLYLENPAAREAARPILAALEAGAAL